MNAYLTKHQYKNTFTEDLWEALGEASEKPVEDIMKTWTQQMGFPVITVGIIMVMMIDIEGYNIFAPQLLASRLYVSNA